MVVGIGMPDRERIGARRGCERPIVALIEVLRRILHAARTDQSPVQITVVRKAVEIQKRVRRESERVDRPLTRHRERAVYFGVCRHRCRLVDDLVQREAEA